MRLPTSALSTFVANRAAHLAPLAGMA